MSAGSDFSGEQGEQASEDQGESSLFDLLDRFRRPKSLSWASMGGRGALNEHLNTRLDSFIVAAIEDEVLTNFKAMNCYFANVAGNPPVADLYCEGPLRPADVDWVPPQVDLKVTLTDLSGGASMPMWESVSGWRRDSGLSRRSSLQCHLVTWSASLPITNAIT